MNFLNNFEIRGKLLLLVSFPLIALLYFSATAVHNSYVTGNNVHSATILTHIATDISHLVHETQKERGMTAGFLGSKGKTFSEKLPQQRKATDKMYQTFLKFNDTVDYSLYPKSFKEHMDKAIYKMEHLQDIRNKVDTLNITAGEAIGYYTKNNALFLEMVNASVKLNKVPEVIKDVAAFNAFLQAKERAGIERAIGSSTIAADKFAPNMRAKLMNLISAQDSFLGTFHGYSSKTENDFFDNLMTGSDLEEIIRIRKVLLSASEIGGFNVDSEYWFNTMTKKIELLKQTEDYIKDNMDIEDSQMKNAIFIASALADLLHETQKERGQTAGFIGSNGTKFINLLSIQKESTDEKLQNLENALNSISTNKFASTYKRTIRLVKSNLSKLEDIRKKVLTQKLNDEEAINYYTQLNSNLLKTIISMIKMGTTANEVRDLTAYYNFLMSKERASIEKAVLSNSFARNKFLPGMKMKFITLVTEQNSYIDTFIRTSQKIHSSYYKQIVKGKVIEEVDRMRQIAFDANSIGGFNEDSHEWFVHMTEKINKLKKVDDYLVERLIHRLEILESKADFSMYFDLITAVFVHLSVWFISLIIASNIIKNLKSFKKGLNFFFAYAVREKNSMKPMEVYGKDEFAQMTIEMNEGIAKTSFIIEQDKKVVQEIDDIMGKIENGFFTYSIQTKGATTEVESLRNSINKMLNGTKIKLDNMNKILNQYGKCTYNYALKDSEKDGLYGDFGSLSTGLTALGHDISSFMALFSNAIDDLDKNTTVLIDTSYTIADTSNTQAKSLNETTKSVEIITASIKESFKNVSKMAMLSDELKESAIEGQILANETASSMDEINKEVNSISDAIGIIDQIAFQTNILSLNAAVEAATAGEAGKGFAVVAQEVRNLASRSAEAASEIKSLVEHATNKAENGEKIVQNMINGYNNLTEKITTTKSIIDTVSIASTDQDTKITEINKEINKIDEVTKRNANTSNELKSISKEIEKLSKNLTVVMDDVSFDDNTKQQVLDPAMTNLISSFKIEQIEFKTKQFEKLDSFTSFQIPNIKDSEIGKWIEKQKNTNAIFTQSTEWTRLINRFNSIHSDIQLYVDKNAIHAHNSELAEIAKTIEAETCNLFDDLNFILEIHCNNIKG